MAGYEPNAEPRTKKILGINGLGRIGKLSLWHQVGRKDFSGIVVNAGRKAGRDLRDIAHYIGKDSTYGSLHRYLYGYRAKPVIEIADEMAGVLGIDGVPVTILTDYRNPKDIPWNDHGVSIVVDATGKFLDPALPPDAKEGSIRGHFEHGAQKVIVSAPFKTGDAPLPGDAKTVIMGINEEAYDPERHDLISSASCTTTCLAHMVKPLLARFGARAVLGMFMATAHAVTASQEILDRLPQAGAKDLRKTRSMLNNIILTTTGAATTLALVLPELEHIGLIAESLRVPLSAGSLIILVMSLQDEESPVITRDLINSVYQDAAQAERRGYLRYSEEQNVSSDIVGCFGPAAIIEGRETRTKSAFVTLDVLKVCGTHPEAAQRDLRIANTQAVMYGWYDNEMGSFSNMLGDLTIKVAESAPAPALSSA